eukprot:3354350-Pyramimonas_sp.AAC.1
MPIDPPPDDAAGAGVAGSDRGLLLPLVGARRGASGSGVVAWGGGRSKGAGEGGGGEGGGGEGDLTTTTH